MTIFALVSGAIFRGVEVKTSKAGKPYATATIRMKDGDATTWIKLAAFSDHVIEDLQRLVDGDALSAQGVLKVEPYQKDGETRIGFSMVVDNLVPLRQPPKERRPKPKPEAASNPIPALPLAPARGFKARCGAPADGLDDDVGF